ncbi:hypothetical protein MYAER_1344 [Microcystis aeruginosa NIES-2549]|uniref:Uncharacterized protein n=1 Tax=Microcystis aeruginosa NIES-2549 TaxID=1641812 RepID=A0A0F6RKB6_MICAE|nr:hypothetical protein MYAER_1344 [Microcystis aeruginosa NIES-2549]
MHYRDNEGTDKGGYRLKTEYSSDSRSHYSCIGAAQRLWEK